MIELLTVLVIIGVLTTIAAVTYGRARDRARLARVKSNVGEIVLSLSDYARDHNGRYPALAVYHNQLPGSISGTDPNPPSDPQEGYPPVIRRMGNAIIGGGPPLVDTGNPLQDDFYRDEDTSTLSAFRTRPNEPDGPPEPMHPVDELALNGHMDAYPVNPLAGPGVPMKNIAFMLYDYDTQTNDNQWVEVTVSMNGEARMGLCAAQPAPGGFYDPIPLIWDETTYPQGDFAYIPMEFTNEQGRYCNGYWIISYGDLNTLQTSPYNKYSLDPINGNPIDPNFANWPNLPPPYGDGSPTTPPAAGTVEYEIKRLMLGALDVRASIFEDQFRSSAQ